MTFDTLEERLRRLEPPQPSAGLRRRVLDRAARRATAGVSIWDRLWFSRPLRVASASLVATLVLISIAEQRLLDRRLELAFDATEAGHAESFEWIVDELGIELGARASFLRTGPGEQSGSTTGSWQEDL